MIGNEREIPTSGSGVGLKFGKVFQVNDLKDAVVVCIKVTLILKFT